MNRTLAPMSVVLLALPVGAVGAMGTMGCASSTEEPTSSSHAAISQPSAASAFAVVEKALALTDDGVLDYASAYGKCSIRVERFGDAISLSMYRDGETDPGRKVVFDSKGTVTSIPADYQKPTTDSWVCGVARYAGRDGLGECVALSYGGEGTAPSAATLASVKFRSGFTVDALCETLRKTTDAPAVETEL